VPDPERLAPGQLIADRYRVGEFIGRGAMGIVYAGEHVRVGRAVAIKVLTRAWSSKPAVRARFEAEARAAAASGHPNVIQVFDVGELPDQRLYLVMEFVAGCDLYTLLWKNGPLPPDRACRLIRDAAFGVRAAHAQGVIHRDLKLENVMVQALPEGENVKVLDFGIAAGVITKQRSTIAGMALGTPEYMAPEQVDGDDPTVQFDIYALGVMLFELLTKRLPIVADTPLELMARKQHYPAVRVTELRPELPAALDQLIADCLEIDPGKRPHSCAAFLERLGAILTELEAKPPVRVTVISDPREPPPRPSRLTRAYVERDSGRVPAGWVRVAGVETARSPASRGAKASRWPWLVAAVGGLGLIGSIALVATQPRSQPAEPVAADVTDPTPQPASEPAPAVVAPAIEPAPTPELAEPEPPSTEPEPPSTEPVAIPDPSTTARCVKIRASAADGRTSHDWKSVLTATRTRECWPRATERKLFETQAYMELGQFGDCLRVGNDLADTRARKWVTLCKQRLAE
jgi:hypothetical protein